MAGAQFWRESERESLCCWAKIAQEFLLDQMWSKQERELARSHDQFHTRKLPGRMMGSSRQSL